MDAANADSWRELTGEAEATNEVMWTSPCSIPEEDELFQLTKLQLKKRHKLY